MLRSNQRVSVLLASIPVARSTTMRRSALATIAAFLLTSATPLPLYSSPLPDDGEVMTRIPGQAQAAGQPIFDCSGMQSTAARLRAGLPVQDEWIRRTEEQLKAAKEGVQQSKEALKELAMKTAKDLAVHQLEMVRQLQDAVKNAPGAIAKAKWLARIDTMKEGAEAVEKATTSLNAGVDLGVAIRQNRATLEEFLKQVQESGISDELGVKAAELAGPVGVAVVETFVAARDAFFAGYSGKMSLDEQDAAERNLAQMRAAKSAVESRAYELEGIVAAECAPKPPAPKDRMMFPDPAPAAAPAPPQPAPQPAPVPTARQSSGHGSAGTVVMLGLAAAGGVVLYQAKKQAATANCVAPTADIPSLCASSNRAACSAALADQLAYCQCEGYSTMNNTIGSCVK